MMKGNRSLFENGMDTRFNGDENDLFFVVVYDGENWKNGIRTHTTYFNMTGKEKWKKNTVIIFTVFDVRLFRLYSSLFSVL